MNQRQIQRLKAILSAFEENIKNFTDDLTAAYDEKDNAIAKQLNRESQLLRANDELRRLVELQKKTIWEREEIIKVQSDEIAALKTELIETKKRPTNFIGLGKYRQLKEKPVNEPKNGFRIKED